MPKLDNFQFQACSNTPQPEEANNPMDPVFDQKKAGIGYQKKNAASVGELFSYNSYMYVNMYIYIICTCIYNIYIIIFCNYYFSFVATISKNYVYQLLEACKPQFYPRHLKCWKVLPSPASSVCLSITPDDVTTISRPILIAALQKNIQRCI